MKGANLDPGDVTGNILRFTEYDDVGALPVCPRRKYTLRSQRLKLIQAMIEIEKKSPLSLKEEHGS